MRGRQTKAWVARGERLELAVHGSSSVVCVARMRAVERIVAQGSAAEVWVRSRDDDDRTGNKPILHARPDFAGSIMTSHASEWVGRS